MVSNTSRNGGAVMIGLNRRRMMGNALPYDAEIEYLESSGTQWIDTGILGNAPIESFVDFSVNNLNAQVILGGSSSPRVYLVEVSYKKFCIGYNKVFKFGSSNIETNTRYNTHTVFKAGTQQLYVNDVLSISSDLNETVTSNYSLALFRLGSSSSSQFNTYGKIYNCKIIQNDVLVRDYIPVRVGQVGYMYDKVSGQLFGNSGSGNFILGNDVN